MWAGAVGRMAGVKVPLVAMHHAYVVTERIEGIQVGVLAGGVTPVSPRSTPCLSHLICEMGTLTLGVWGGVRGNEGASWC